MHRLSRRPDPYFLLGFASVLVLAGLYAFQVRRGTALPSALPPSLFAAAQGQELPLTLGRLGSPVRVVEVMEYQCPACAEAHRRNWPVLQRLSGQGRVVFRAENVPLPSHPNAIPAGVFAACVAAVSPDRFWEYHAMLLAHQDEWADKYGVEPALAGLAHRAGADTTAARACLNERGELIAATLRGRFRTFAEAGFSSIPVWSVNGRIVPWDRVESAITAAEQANRGEGR